MTKKTKEKRSSPLRLTKQAIGPRIPEGILRYRLIIIMMLCLPVIASVFGLFHIRADFSFEMLFLSGDEEAVFFEEFKKRFEESSRDIIVLVQGEELFSQEGLKRIQTLARTLEDTEGIEKALTVFNAPSIQGTTDGVVIESLVDDILPATAREIEAIKKKALENRIFRRALISEDGSTLALFARLAPYIQTEKEKRPVIESVKTTAKSIMGDRFPVYFSGIPTIQKEYTDEGLSDIRRFFLFSAGIVCFFLYITFRNFAGLYLPLITVLTSVLFLLGLMALFGEKINMINNIVPSLLLVYGIADSIHIIHRYYEELGKGLSKKEALLVTIRHMALACFMTSVTTAVGFLSLTTATIHIIKTFGLFAGAGIILAYLTTILLLPILLSFHTAPRRTGKIWKGQGAIEKILAAIGTLNERYPKRIIAGGMLLFAASIFFCTRVNIESYILEELTEDNPIVQANRIMEDEMAGVFPYIMQISAGSEGDTFEPDFLERVDRLESFIGTQPWIRKTMSVVDILKEMNQAMNNGDPAFYRVPETRELVVQYLFLYGMSGNQEDIDVLVTPDGSHIRLACQGIDMGTRNFFELIRRTQEKAAELFTSPESFHVTGRSFIAQRALNNIIRDMLVSLFTAFGIICITVSLLYRSIKVGIISMLPNLIPLVFTMGFMGLAGMTLRTSTVITFAISLGIAVDDTIHYITRFREELLRSGDYTQAMARTLRTAGRAIVLTTFIMISGFLVFLISNFNAIRDFGILSSLTIGAALVGSLIFLPASLNTFKPWKVEK